ncbi:MAG TPA: acyl carrier protein [Pseudonocardiaceae bacterium]
MNRTEALDHVTAVLRSGLGVPGDLITEEASLRDDLGLDSLDLFELVTGLEARLGTRVSQTELPAVQTVADAVELVLTVVAAAKVA